MPTASQFLLSLIKTTLILIRILKVLYFGSIRMNTLMLDTRNVEQTKDVRMYT